MVSRTLGRYEILEKIGAGGMGEVYRAHDPRLDRDVAIKVLPRGSLSDEHQRKRFRKEALALSRLNHPSIATVFDFDTVEGTDFLVMELVPGETLQERLAAGPLSIDETVRVGGELAAGLAAAHDRGVIHRDLKPGNVRITPDGRVKILDFGIAKLFKPSAPDESQEKVTDSSLRAGTLPYMSPEQIRGEKLGPASDLFSLGTILYEMVTGKHPFAAEYEHAVVYNVLNADPEPPSKLRSGVSKDVERTILRLLEKDPKNRFQSGAELSGALGISEANQHRAWPVRGPIAKIAVGALGLAVVFLIAAWLRGPSATYSAEPDQRAIRRLTYAGTAGVPVWSPDGAEIAYRQDANIHVAPAEGGSPRVLDLDGKPTTPWGWTPDSRAIIAHSLYPVGDKWSVVKVGLHGEEPQVLVENATFGDVSHDGKYLAYTSWNPEPDWGIWIQNLATGAKRQLVQPKGKGTFTYKAKWAPDDRELSYIRWNGSGHEVWLVSSDGTNDRRIETDPIQLGGQYCWFKDGRSLLIAGELYGIWSTWQVSVTGKEHTRRTVSSEEERHVSLAPGDERFVFQKSQEISRVAIVDVADGSLSYPFELDIAAKHPSFSSDGKSLFFQVLVGTRWQIWETRLSGSGSPSPVIALKETSAFQPAIDEQGNVIHVRANVGRVWRFGRIGWSQTLWRSSRDGGRHETIAAAGDRVERIAPTPTRGNRLLFSVDTPENYEAVSVLSGTTQPLVLFEDDDNQVVSAFDWGAGDRDVLIAHSEPEKPQQTRTVSVIDVETKQISRLFDLAVADSADTQLASAWISAMTLSPNRKVLALLVVVQRTNEWPRELYVYDLETERIRRVCGFETKAIPNTISWSPDNRHIAVELYRERSDVYISEPAERPAISRR